MFSNFPYFTKSYYTKKQNFYFWWLYYLRQWADLLSGILGIITFGFIQLDWGSVISEKILLAMLKFYKESRNG